ncbi:ABC transporter ATP-binding protein [bacterium]|nr:ABC transporter ATP-binding protein [bacterium]
MSDVLLRLDGVRFGYDSAAPVLEGVTFELRAGERVGLIGSNGSGKTTLLHLIVGLMRPTAGTIEAFGQARRVEGDFQEVRQRVGLVFQDAEDQLFCPTVAEDVAFGPLNLGKGPEETQAVVEATLATLGLEGYEERITYKLSGGEKRLVSLATVLAMAPDVLLLDEPTAGLDEDAEERLIEVLLGLEQAMVIVSHDRALLARLASRVVRLREGRIEEGA